MLSLSLIAVKGVMLIVQPYRLPRFLDDGGDDGGGESNSLVMQTRPGRRLSTKSGRRAAIHLVSHVQHMTKILVGWSLSRDTRCGFTQEQFGQLLKFPIEVCN